MSVQNAHNRGRGRGRGNRGKYLRALGRRGLGRGAEFNPRLLLEEEQEDSDSDEDDQEERYAKREIVDNGDKYVEPEVDTNVEEAEPEPEVDISSFLVKQRLQISEGPSNIASPNLQDDDIDHSLAKLTLSGVTAKPRKENVQQIEWDASLEELKKEKEAADAIRDLKSRFLKSQPRLQKSGQRGNKQQAQGKLGDSRHIEENTHPLREHKDNKAEMEGFLDDLLS